MKRFLALLVVLGGLSGCQEKVELPASQAQEFHLGASERAQLLGKIEKVKLGQSLEAVKNVLGKPDFEDFLAQKKIDSPVIGTKLYYVIDARDLNLLIDKGNEYFVLKFGADKTLATIRHVLPNDENR